MPLTSFGAVLTFAESLEVRDAAFYGALIGHRQCGDLFSAFTEEGRHTIRTLQRTRRENVTEMILEPIRDFVRAPFVMDPGDPATLDPGQALAAALALEARAVSFYRQAADKIGALPEVARVLRRLADKRQERLDRLEAA